MSKMPTMNDILQFLGDRKLDFGMTALSNSQRQFLMPKSAIFPSVVQLQEILKNYSLIHTPVY
jgi:hypothetical protein